MTTHWRRVTIGEICRVVSGTTPSTSDDSHWDGEIAWITPSDLGALKATTISQTERTITEAARVSHRMELLPVGSIVMSSRAPIGHLAMTGVPACLNQGCKGFVCGKSIAPGFLLHALRAHMERIQDMGRGAIFAEVSKSAIEGFSLDIPIDVDEQRAIALRLDLQLKECLAARTAVSAQHSDALRMVQAELRDSFFREIPVQGSAIASTTKNVTRGWRWHRLTDLARLESGHTPSRRRPEWWGGDVPWLALPDIRKLHGKIAHATTENTNAVGLANSSARLLPVGTVCLCRDASIGFVTLLGRPMATSQHFCNWICDPEKLDPDFLMYAFMASHDYLRELGSGSVLKTIYMPTIKSFHICAPDIDEQRRIARTLRDRLAAAENLTGALKTRLADIERLPQRLLAAAFGQN